MRDKGRRNQSTKKNLSLSLSVLWLRVASSGWPPTFLFPDLFIAIYLTPLFALKTESTSRLNISIPPALCSLLQRL